MNKSASRITLALSLAAAFMGCDSGNASGSDSVKADQSSWESITLQNDAVRITGRHSWSPEGYAFASWSGAAVTVGFNGTALKLFMTSGSAVYDIFVDGEEFPSDTIDLSAVDGNSKPVTEFLVVDSLPPGNHSVRIQKNTESYFSSVLFMGFEIAGKPEPKALPPMPEKRLEFFGNSITCGFGVLDTVSVEEFNLQTEDHFYSYAGQTARILGAEEHTVCTSGKGFIRNFDNSTEGLIPDTYKFTDYDGVGNWDLSSWTPDIVFVNLGTNDFHMGIPDSATFTNAVLDFAKNLREDYPKAGIVLLTGPMMFGEPLETCKRYLDAAAGQFKSSLDTNIYRFNFEPQGSLGTGGSGHPNRAQAEKDAKSLAAWIQQTFHW